MSVSLEKIDMLMERANISYKEAKDALELYDGDIVEALIYLEASNKTSQSNSTQKASKSSSNTHSHSKNSRKHENDFFDDVKKFFAKLHKTSFVIGNNSKRILDIPLTIAAILVIFTMPVSLFLLILPYVMGYKISILDTDGKKVDFENIFGTEEHKKSQKNDDEDKTE